MKTPSRAGSRSPLFLLCVFLALFFGFALAAAGPGEDLHRPGTASRITIKDSTPRVLENVTVRDAWRGKTYTGPVDLGPTLSRIQRGEALPPAQAHSHDGSTFFNRGNPLPPHPRGYYTEYTHPTPGVRGPGVQRIIVGRGGEIYYSPDHYETFLRIQ